MSGTEHSRKQEADPARRTPRAFSVEIGSVGSYHLLWDLSRKRTASRSVVWSAQSHGAVNRFWLDELPNLIRVDVCDHDTM